MTNGIPSIHIDTNKPIGLEWAHPLVRDWFIERFGTPTEPQIAGWPPILASRDTLICAPTGSGKTLTAFMVCIDKLVRQAIAGRLSDNTEIIYVSPLKALGNDIQKKSRRTAGSNFCFSGKTRNIHAVNSYSGTHW